MEREARLVLRAGVAGAGVNLIGCGTRGSNNTHLATFNHYVLVYVLCAIRQNWRVHSYGDRTASSEWSGDRSKGLGIDMNMVESVHCVLLMIVLDYFQHVNFATRTRRVFSKFDQSFDCSTWVTRIIITVGR